MKRQAVIALFCLSSLILSFAAQAERTFYGTLSAGYVKNEIDDFELDKGSYKIGIGYELTPQWYLEAGYQSLGEENAGDNAGLIGADVAEFSSLYLSGLGKARNQYGELFYRLGVVRIDANVQSVSNLDCGGPAISPLVCETDESLLGGVIGLGFDFYVHHTTMVRFEVEHIQGEKDYSATAAYVGVRLNF